MLISTYILQYVIRSVYNIIYMMICSTLQYAEELVPMLNVAERACTVNAMGEYVDHRYTQCVTVTVIARV